MRTDSDEFAMNRRRYWGALEKAAMISLETSCHTLAPASIRTTELGTAARDCRRGVEGSLLDLFVRFVKR